MEWKKHMAAPILASAVLAACGGGGGGGDTITPPSSNPPAAEAPTTKERIAALEAEGNLPKLDRSADLKGPDANGDGVRDDIEAILRGKYQGAQQEATMQFARSYRAVFDLPEGDRIAAKAISIAGSRALVCVSRQFRGDQRFNSSVVMREIVSMTFNTKARLNAYMAYNKALSGSVLTLPEGDTCE
ncbi:hypothetical protein E4O93_05405 [Diaphorobacter sp. DS2]|nr:hypothetical protein E4O93_05405 [Diaphorobacter sp. DS2]